MFRVHKEKRCPKWQDGPTYDYAHVTMRRRLNWNKAKAEYWSVESRAGASLGAIFWNKTERQYCFRSNVDVVYTLCHLEEIEHFLRRMRKRQ